MLTIYLWADTESMTVVLRSLQTYSSIKKRAEPTILLQTQQQKHQHQKEKNTVQWLRGIRLLKAIRDGVFNPCCLPIQDRPPKPSTCSI